MRKFKFFALAFAALSFAACSDDAIDGQGGNTGTVGDGTPAYLTVSFSANSGSSTRADDDNNSGDTHEGEEGGQEDSGHESIGLEGESKIKTALVVLNPASDNQAALAKVYSVVQDATSATEDNFVLAEQNTQTYNAHPIEVTTGTYDILVVLNPVSTLTSILGSGNTSQDLTVVRNLYNTILTENYSYSSYTSPSTPTWTDNYTNVANSIGMGVGYENSPHSTDNASFMMANKAASSVTVTADNTERNPAQAEVTVERVLSKITFREKAESGGVAANAYEVKVNLGSAPALTTEGAVNTAEATETANWVVKTLNLATDLVDEPVFAEYNEDGALVAVYKVTKEDDDSDAKHEIEDVEYTVYHACQAVIETTYDAASAEEQASMYVVEDISSPSVDLTLDPDAPLQSDTWYVQLQGYALVNLSKSVNYVRHTVANGGVMNPFGTVSTNTYLWTPGWDEKNSAVASDANDGTFENFTATTYFYNTLKQVSDESKTLAVGADGIIFNNEGYFKNLNTLIDDNEDVTNNGTHPSTYGDLMSYCFENSTDTEHQQHGLSTGIAFVARIYSDAACQTPIERLYLYNNHNYTSLQQIADAYGDATPPEIKALLEDNDITQADLDAAGVTEYNSNICYYYTSEIKHFDNGLDDTMGVMEYAIMRNNIYSLAVTKIDEIGAPFVDPKPDTPNESVQAALDINVMIEPWIVRYNDIEFN